MMDQEVKNDAHTHQFTLDVNGKRSFLKYNLDDHSINLYSTFVPAELRGQKLGERLVEHAIKYARENKLKIIIRCPFVEKYFSEHPELSDLISS